MTLERLSYPRRPLPRSPAKDAPRARLRPFQYEAQRDVVTTYLGDGTARQLPLPAVLDAINLCIGIIIIRSSSIGQDAHGAGDPVCRAHQPDRVAVSQLELDDGSRIAGGGDAVRGDADGPEQGGEAVPLRGEAGQGGGTRWRCPIMHVLAQKCVPGFKCENTPPIITHIRPPITAPYHAPQRKT